MTSELKPCPFCGGKARMWASQNKYNKDGSYEVIGCSNVDCLIEPTTEEYLPYEEATRRWNTRAVPDVPELVRYDLVNPDQYRRIISETPLGEYVRHDQAAAMLAVREEAYDKEYNILVDKHNFTVQQVDSWMNTCGALEQRVEEAEAELAQIKAQEPVAWRGKHRNDSDQYWNYSLHPDSGFDPEKYEQQPLYAAPVDLKAENERLREILQLFCNAHADQSGDPNYYILMMETAFNDAQIYLHEVAQ